MKDMKIMVFSFVFLVLLFFLSVDAFRIISGGIFIFFLPGYALTRLFFKDLNYIEMISYSIGLSICILIIDGLILDRFWEISLIPILLSIGTFVILAIAIEVVLKASSKR